MEFIYFQLIAQLTGVFIATDINHHTIIRLECVNYVQKEKCLRMESVLQLTSFATKQIEDGIFVAKPFETGRHRCFHHLHSQRIHHRYAQWLLDNDEVVLGNSERVHIGWMQSPSSRLCANHICIVEHLMAIWKTDYAIFGTGRRHRHAQIEYLGKRQFNQTTCSQWKHWIRSLFLTVPSFIINGCDVWVSKLVYWVTSNLATVSKVFTFILEIEVLKMFNNHV